MGFSRVGSDQFYMEKALLLAEKAGEIGEVPIGALVVSPEGIIVGEGWNKIESGCCQDQHAEMEAIRTACAQRKDWRLDGCTLFVTLEPCVMCVGCIALSRINRLVFAAASPIYGYQGRREDLCALYNKTLCNITGGICAEKAEAQLRAFFEKKR